MATLREVLEQNIDKYVKIGGKAGFFFAGYIHSDYEDLIKEVLQIESSRLVKYKEAQGNELLELKKTWNDRLKLVDKNDIAKLSELEMRKECEINSVKYRMDKYEKSSNKILNLLDSEIREQYRSHVDGSLIILVNCSITGSIDDREVMINKHPLLAQTYNI